MELKEFVTETLVEIQQRVQKATQSCLELNTTGVINPSWGPASQRLVTEVKFDIAVTVTDKTGKQAGGGIKVMGIKIGGEMSGSEESGHVSRIQFSIPIIPPVTTVNSATDQGGETVEPIE